LSDNARHLHKDPLVLFLDDAFCYDEALAILVGGGYTVEQFTNHFPASTGRAGKRAQGIKDKPVIHLSHRKGWLIVTRDKNMRITHVEEFKKHPNASVLATANCDPCDDPTVWVTALVKAKLKLERKVRRQPRPWYGQYNRDGDVTVCRTIDCQTTRRRRPKEI
jgi:predicted nuclease of predicted toxin-antitoxin system